MKVQTLLGAQSLLGCEFKQVRTGDPRWIRLFIIRPDGCQIGRLSFHDHILTNIKEYKTCMQRLPIDESDRIYTAIRYFIETRQKLECFDELVEIATKNAKEDLERKLEARKLLPQKKRSRIWGKDPRLEMYKLLRELINEHRTSTRAAEAPRTEDHEVHSRSSHQAAV